VLGAVRQVAAPLPHTLAVRRTQLAFLSGEISAAAAGGDRGGASRVPGGAAPPAALSGWRHPYYWAPFVLYGTGR
jgi:CHAT domain-containing protein